MSAPGGYYLMYRGWMDHPALLPGREPFSRREAWVWLIENAAWCDTRTDVFGTTVAVKRGQISTSLRSLMKVWNWSMGGVQRFVGRLKTDSMIDAATDSGRMVITICNYDKYQLQSAKADATSDARPDAELMRRRFTSDAQKKEGNTGKEGNTRNLAEASPPLSADAAAPDLLPTADVVTLKAGDDARAAVALWNALATEFDLSRVVKVTDARRRALLARLRDCGGIEGWKVALQKIRENDYLLGRTGKGWAANFDFLLQSSRFTKLMEDGYRQRSNARPAAAPMPKYMQDMGYGRPSSAATEHPSDPFTIEGEAQEA